MHFFLQALALSNFVFCYIPHLQSCTIDYVCVCVCVYCRQKWLAVIDLRDTTKVKTDRKLGRSNKYEVKTVLWNPHHEKRDLLVSTVRENSH